MILKKRKITKTEENLCRWIIIEEIEDTVRDLICQEPPDYEVW